MKNLLCVVLLVIFLTVPTQAQKVTGESEVTVGGFAVSQYVFIDGKGYNASFRYVFVRNGVHRLETGVGPTIHPWGTTVKWAFGPTSDSAIRMAQAVVVPVRKGAIIWIADAKVSMCGKPHTLYQKIFIPLTAAGSVQLRLENLLVDFPEVKSVFARLSVEVRRKLKTGYVYGAPFIDLKGGIGANMGYRF